jgi:hypothetical protein
MSLLDYQQRFGLGRRDARNHSLHQRQYGKSASDRMLEKKYSKITKLFALMAVDTIEQESHRELDITESDGINDGILGFYGDFIDGAMQMLSDIPFISF